MNKFYITLGQQHVHIIGNKVLTPDHVLEINAEDYAEATHIAYDIFDEDWSRVLEEEELKLEFFPKGIIKLELEDD